MLDIRIITLETNCAEFKIVSSKFKLKVVSNGTGGGVWVVSVDRP
jgi:hypothetical protein